MKVKQSFILPHAWEAVAKVLVDPSFNVEREKLREGVISSEFVKINEGEHEILFELHTKEYKRKKTGGLDKSGTFQSVTKCRYDGRNKRLRWDYKGEGGGMVRLGGVYILQPRGDSSTDFVHEVEIEVKIPIIGKQIAKMIAKEFERDDDRYPKLWEKYLSN